MQRLYDYSGNPLDITDKTLSIPDIPADAEATGELVAISAPEFFGAVGDGVADDTVALQSAINTKMMFCRNGKTYKITAPLIVKQNTFIDLNGSTILCTAKHAFHNFANGDSYGVYNGNGNITICNGTVIGGCVSFIHGEGVKLFNVHFKNVLNDHFIEICACKDYVIENCSFVGMQNLTSSVLEYINIDTNASYAAFPHNKAGQNDPVFYDMSTNKDIVIRNCYFSIGTDTYGYGFNAVGIHARNVADTYAENVTITGNIIRGFTGCGVRVNAMENAYVAENDIRVVGDGVRVGDVADCIGVVIKGNYIEADSGNGIALTSGQYTDLTVAYNVHDGMNDMS